jgi:hypothetical protein
MYWQLILKCVTVDARVSAPPPFGNDRTAAVVGLFEGSNVFMWGWPPLTLP